MPRFIGPLALVCLLLASCTKSAEKEPEPEGLPDASSLLETDRAFAKMSADSGSVAAFSAYLANDAIQMPSGTSPIVGRDSIVASMVADPGVMLLWEPKHAEVARSGELGWTWGVYQVKFKTDEGEEMTSSGKYVNVWRKQDDDSWKVIVDMGNSGV